MVARRALAGGALLTLAAAATVTALGKPWSAFALTVTAAVGMINGLWLERTLASVLQPGKARLSPAAMALTVARWTLWVALFAFLFVLRKRVEWWAVLVGIACFLTALGGAAVRASGNGEGEG